LATIKKRYLAPLNPIMTITEADRPKIHDLIGKQVADILTGSQSYYPDGVQKEPWTLASDLQKFITSIDDLRGRMNDPSNILGNVTGHLTKHAEDFRSAIENGEPVDHIELPNELSPVTEDNRVIHVDPDPDQFSLPNPLLPKNWSKELKASFGSFDDVENAPAVLGVYSGRPMPQWIVPPPIFGRR
jgi:hypothetical protein